MKAATRLVAFLALLLFVWYLFADRMTPYTSNARVKAIVIDLVPQVSGYVAALAVTNAQLVEAGDLLARIDQRPFVLEVEKARSALQSATQSVGASSSEVEVAQASLVQAKINLENVQVQSARIFELDQKGLVAKAKVDDMRADLAAAKSKVAGAQADLEKARQQLGEEGADNAQIRSAIAQLGEAQLNLEWTELHAPSRGVVADLKIGEGTFAKVGQGLMNLVSFEEVWVEAYLTENSLARVSVGDPVEIVLDLYPGRIFNGEVSSITNAASVGPDSPGSLPSVPREQAWLRDPQRFPVRIRMLGYEIGSEHADIRRNLNGQANVIVYTGDHGFLNTLGAAWIRLISWLSYAY
jgi:multidrug resistance efflux pump